MPLTQADSESSLDNVDIDVDDLPYSVQLPAQFDDVWDAFHVKLPCSSSYLYKKKSDPDNRLPKVSISSLHCHKF